MMTADDTQPTTPAVRPMPKKPHRIALIDGDVLCYRVAISAQLAVNWADEDQEHLWTAWFKSDETVARFRAFIEDIKTKTGSDYAILCLTDKTNWRMDVLPTYKSNRKDTLRPIALPFLREHAQGAWAAYLKPGLEGDDILGILATKEDFLPGVEKVIVTIDKDLQTIPGKHFNIDHAYKGIFTVTPEDADYFHLWQTLTGDTVDGYTGCPGCGPKTAHSALSEGIALEAYDHTITRGPRKGEVEKRFKEIPANSPWHTVVSHYEAAGLTEADALQQARVARILRASDYNFETKEPILWTP